MSRSQSFFNFALAVILLMAIPAATRAQQSPGAQAPQNTPQAQPDSQSPQVAPAQPERTDPREPPAAPFAGVLGGESNEQTEDTIQSPPGTPETQVVQQNPVDGVQNETVASHTATGNYLAPSISATSQLQVSSSGGNASVSGTEYLLGTLDLHHVSDRTQVLLHYTGGGMFSSYLNTTVQDLEFTYTANGRRWSFTIGDEGNYLSQSPFGFGGVGGLSFISGLALTNPGGVPAPLLSAFLTPNQTIPTMTIPRFSDAAALQAVYRITPRSSWTVAASGGTLQFIDAQYIDSIDGVLQTSYNYELSPLSTFAVLYRFDRFQFTGFPERVQDHVAEIGYSRNVTGRMSLTIAAGPALQMLEGLLSGTQNSPSWAVDSLLSYRLNRTSFLFSYDHMLTGGSGVLVGAETNQLQGTLEHALSRRWQFSASSGYAKSVNLIPVAVNLGEQPYNSWFGVARFNYEIRPGANLLLSYEAQLEVRNVAGCSPLVCQANGVGHEFTANFNFGLRPLLLK